MMGNYTSGSRLFATVAFLLLLTATLAGCGQPQAGSAPSAAVTSGSPPPKLTLVSADGQFLDATETVLTDQPAISEATAKERAAQALSNSKTATAVQAHYVALTLSTEKTPRNVWLITYSGVPFSYSGCTCHVDSATANSIVAIATQPGESTMIFGME